MTNVNLLAEIGKTYGNLTVLSIEPSDKISTRASVKCICGKVVITKLSRVRKGVIKSCGCLRIINVVKSNTTHGLNNTPLHKLYRTMKGRCFTKKSENYKNYGGRGITVC